MTLSQLLAELKRHNVHLSLSPSGGLRPASEREPPSAVLDGIRQHRAVLLLRLCRGQSLDGRYDLLKMSGEAGRCGSCAHWRGPDPYGDGQCIQGRAAHGWPDGSRRAPVITTIHHACQVNDGRSWRRSD